MTAKPSSAGCVSYLQQVLADLEINSPVLFALGLVLTIQSGADEFEVVIVRQVQAYQKLLFIECF